MGNIRIGDQIISFQDIQSGNWRKQEPYFQSSLRFCQEWLNGKESFVLKTSGSTGTPKSIKVGRSQMESSAKATGDFFGINPDQTLLCCIDTDRIGGKMMLVRAMEWKSMLYLTAPSSNPLLHFSTDQSFDFAALVPLQLETCLENKKSRTMLHRIKNLIIGGAPISSSLRKKASVLTGNVFQTYGMTETVSHIALANLKSSQNLVYHTLPGVHIRQTSDHRLEIAAPMAHAAWILTNDLVELISNSEFIWKGRSDFTINSGGVKVQPEEVEAIISDIVEDLFPGKRFFIDGIPDPKLGQKIVLILEEKEENKSSADRLLYLIKGILPRFHDPKAVYFIPSFVETVTNKINRRETLKKLRTE